VKPVALCTTSAIDDHDRELFGIPSSGKDSKLQRIEEWTFEWSGLTTIEVPASVEVLCNTLHFLLLFH
jgi:hypothetical protein